MATQDHKTLLLLAVTQILGWASVLFVPALASHIASDLQTTLPTVFLSASIMSVTMGLGAPMAGRAFKRVGIKPVMTAGAACLGIGLIAIGFATDIVMFLAAWVHCRRGGRHVPCNRCLFLSGRL